MYSRSDTRTRKGRYFAFLFFFLFFGSSLTFGFIHGSDIYVAQYRQFFLSLGEGGVCTFIVLVFCFYFSLFFFGVWIRAMFCTGHTVFRREKLGKEAQMDSSKVLANR